VNQVALEPEAAPVAAPERIRMVVVSDIHATAQSDPASNVAEATAADLEANALTAACSFLPTVAAGADCVICPGDFVHRGQTGPMDWVWRELHGLATALDAPLVATAGNHDVLLRPKGPDKPNKALRALRPKFPYDDRDCVAAYWAHDFAIVAERDWRILSLNSSAHLGFWDESEAEHGRLGRDCPEELPEWLDRIGPGCPVNICVAHHHPQEWTEDSDKETNHMLEGDRLIRLLEGRPEHWMLIHGHMHHPRLDYVGHGSAGPARLASGSIGANLLADSGVRVRNQLHIVDFDLGAQAMGLMIAGDVTSYDWEPGEGWVEAGPRSGLPFHTSFGYRRDGSELAAWLLAEARGRDQRVWTWQQIVELEPRARFLTDFDRSAFFDGVRRLEGGVSEEVEEVTFQWA
jgi:hypothetical protein